MCGVSQGHMLARVLCNIMWHGKFIAPLLYSTKKPFDVARTNESRNRKKTKTKCELPASYSNNHNKDWMLLLWCIHTAYASHLHKKLKTFWCRRREEKKYSIAIMWIREIVKCLLHNFYTFCRRRRRHCRKICYYHFPSKTLKPTNLLWNMKRLTDSLFLVSRFV